MSGTTQHVGRRLAADCLNPRRPIEASTFRVIAEYANQHEDHCAVQQVLSDLVDTITPHLDSRTTPTWWRELRRALTRAEAADTAGPAWDEVGVDWDARATEAANVLAGVR